MIDFEYIYILYTYNVNFKKYIQNMPLCSLVAIETDHGLCISWFLDV